MISKNVVVQFGDEEIVPIRAVPFVTGGDMGPRCLAGILSDPNLSLEAFVLGPDGTATLMFPKEWNQFKDRLSLGGKASRDLIDCTTLEVLPSSTFVYRENLWRTYEDLFLHDREALRFDTPGEQQNCMLQWITNIPKGLVDLVFDGFHQLSQTNAGTEISLTSIDFELLATPDQLVAAFGAWGLKASWFKSPAGHTWLLRARKVKGQGQRGHVATPLYCPHEVMNGLVTQIRGRKRLGADKGWKILQDSFPKVFDMYQIGDTRAAVTS
jgi:hypothetical protein